MMKDFCLAESRHVEFRWEVFGETDLVHQAGCTFGNNYRRPDRSAEHDVRSEVCLVVSVLDISS
jgi:hypothetical protein